MIYLFWSLLNIAILLYFLYLLVRFLFQGKKIFEGKLQSLSIAVLVLGVIHIASAKGSDKSDDIVIDKAYTLENSAHYETLTLEDKLTMDVNLSVYYATENGILIPVKATSNLSGLVSGYGWKIQSIHTSNKTGKVKKDFNAVGILEWKLFGITIYSQEKHFKGEI